MLKFNCVLLMVILCSGFHLSSGEKLKCEFKDVKYSVVGDLYSCKVTSLDNYFNNMIIDGFTGVHMTSKNDKDVKGIYIYLAKLKYIPHGLGSLSNLLALVIDRSELVEIKTGDFLGMQNLEYLNLYGNELISLSSDAFSSLAKLKEIRLGFNQIKYIGFGAFDKLKNLNEVDLKKNICVNKNYYGATEIIQMKEDLKVNCVEPISTTTTTKPTTTTTTQNPKEVELETLKNEAKEQQQKNEIELNKLRDDLKKEQLENTNVNKEKDALAKEKVSLLKERNAFLINHDAMMMELTNKTSEINELKTNCKQPIEALDVKLNVVIGLKENQEDLKLMLEQLLKASQENQMECQDIIKLRAELSTAKDELKIANNQREKEQDEKIKVTNKNDQLEKELSEAKETIQQKLPKMEQTIEDFYMEVMDLKIERHNERQNSIALRSKLIEANEQLATCEINERSLI